MQATLAGEAYLRREEEMQRTTSSLKEALGLKVPGLGPAHIQWCCRLGLKRFFLGGGGGGGREDDDGALRLMIILRTHIAFL